MTQPFRVDDANPLIDHVRDLSDRLDLACDLVRQVLMDAEAAELTPESLDVAWQVLEDIQEEGA